MPRIYGYARTADFGQAPSFEEQQKLAERKAAHVGGIWQGCRAEHDDGSWTDRPGFRGLLEDLEAGDLLVVHDLRCLDSKQKNAIETAQALVDRQVHVHVLKATAKGLELDLNPDVGGRSFLKLWREMLTCFDQAHRDSIRDALQYRKRRGMVYNAHPALGKKRIVHKGRKMDVWDRRQCSLIVEIWVRHSSGASIYSIARDFNRRRERTGSGGPWVRRYGKNRRLNANRLYRALAFYEDMLARGERFCV